MAIDRLSREFICKILERLIADRMPVMRIAQPPLEDLYAGLPSFDCEPGCTACCKGIVSLSLPELLAIEAFCADRPGGILGVAISAGTISGCPFRTNKGCPVYPVRPFMCRLFGFRFLHPELAGQPFCPCRQAIRPGDAEAKKYKLYLRFCEENGFAIIGQPRAPEALPAAIADNRATAARFPELTRFVELLAGRTLADDDAGRPALE